MPRGPRNSGNSGTSRYNVGLDRSGSGFSTWDVDTELFISAVRAVLGNGDAVLLSLTSDGGALSIQLYSNGAKQSVYCTDADQLEVVLNTLKASSLD